MTILAIWIENQKKLRHVRNQIQNHKKDRCAFQVYFGVSGLLRGPAAGIPLAEAKIFSLQENGTRTSAE
jgi:hypothetical protein